MTGVQKLILGYIGVKIANFPEDIVLDYKIDEIMN